MSAINDSFLTGNFRLFRATEDLRRGDAVIEGENAEIVNQAVDAAAYALNHRSRALLNFWGDMRINGVVVRQPDDMNLTSLQRQAVAHAERLRTLHDRRIEDELVNELQSVVDNVLGGAPEPPPEALRYLQRPSPLQQMEEVVIAARLAHELERLTEEPPTLNGSPVTSADEAPADPITMPSLEAAMLQLRVNADERLHRRAGISPEEPAPPIMPSQEEFQGFNQLLNEPLPDAPTLSPEMAEETHRRIIAAEALLREIGDVSEETILRDDLDTTPESELHAERLTDEPGEMVAIVPRPKGCPQCGGKLQHLSNDNTFCLDCDWDNLSPLSDDTVKNSPATLSFHHKNVYVEFGMRLAVHNRRDEQIEIGFYEHRAHPSYRIRLAAGQVHQNPNPPPWSDRIQTVRVRNISRTIWEWRREDR